VYPQQRRMLCALMPPHRSHKDARVSDEASAKILNPRLDYLHSHPFLGEREKHALDAKLQHKRGQNEGIPKIR
jgi:hypothetical protein